MSDQQPPPPTSCVLPPAPDPRPGGELVDRPFGRRDRLVDGDLDTGVVRPVGVWLRRNPSA